VLVVVVEPLRIRNSRDPGDRHFAVGAERAHSRSIRGAMSNRILPRRVLVSLGVASAFVGAVVLAGVLFRHHDPPRHPSPRPASTASTR
jgi:hypothetical protein